MLDIQRSYLAHQAGFAGAFGKGAVPIVMEIAKLAVEVPGRNHDVIKSIVVEIIDDDAAGQIVCIKPEPVADIPKPGQLVFRGEHLRRDEKLRRDFVWIFTQGHGGEVEQPASSEVVWKFRQLLVKQRDGTARTAGQQVVSLGFQWKQARIGVMRRQAVFLLTQSHKGNSLIHPQFHGGAGVDLAAISGHKPLQVGKRVKGLIRPTGSGLLNTKLELQSEPVISRLSVGHLAFQERDEAIAHKGHRLRFCIVTELGKQLRHPPSARRRIPRRQDRVSRLGRLANRVERDGSLAGVTHTRSPQPDKTQQA